MSAARPAALPPALATLALPPALATLALLAFASALASCGGEPAAPGPRRIVLVVVDMLRSDHVGAYGGASTPAMDGLAARGQAFPNALSSFHQTTMSMGALFTGRTPSLESGERRKELPWTSQTWCGMARYRQPGETPAEVCIPEGVPTLAERLREAGYATLGVVSNPLIFSPLGYEKGFDRWVEVGEAHATPGAETAHLRDGEAVNAAARRALAGHEASSPLFLYLHYMDVHDFKWAETSYAASVAAVDRHVGELLAHLEGAGLLEDAVVFLVSDHGELLGEQVPILTATHFGNPSFEPVLRVPLIVAPAVFAEAEAAALVRSEDVAGLVLSAAGLPAPDAGDLAPGELFLTEQKWQTYRGPEGRWKSTLSRRDDSFYLFDLESPDGETTNVAAEHPEVVAAHRARMGELGALLAARNGTDRSTLSDDEERRLRALGYLE